MQKVYLLELSQLAPQSGKFFTYRADIFSSLKKAETEIEQSIKVNKGFDIDIEDSIKEKGERIVDYKALNSIGGSFSLRYRLRVKELK
jgi:hypothetical protein